MATTLSAALLSERRPLLPPFLLGRGPDASRAQGREPRHRGTKKSFFGDEERRQEPFPAGGGGGRGETHTPMGAVWGRCEEAVGLGSVLPGQRVGLLAPGSGLGLWVGSRRHV